MKSSGAGEKCKNSVFVGDYNNCNPCCFGNNGTRTGTKPDIIQEWGLSGLGVVDDNGQSNICSNICNGFGGTSDIRLDQQTTFQMFYQSMMSVYIGMYHPPDDYVLLPGINFFIAAFFVANPLCFTLIHCNYYCCTYSYYRWAQPLFSFD